MIAALIHGVPDDLQQEQFSVADHLLGQGEVVLNVLVFLG